MALTIIGSDEGAVLVDGTSGYPLQGCRSFGSTGEAEAFLEWYDRLGDAGGRPDDIRRCSPTQVAAMRGRWDAEQDAERERGF